MNIRAIFLVIYIVVNYAKADDSLIVNTAVGAIRGIRSEDGQYNMYMGIPYGRVNENNPFGASLPPAYFDEIFEANDDSSRCPQIEEFNNTMVGDLDCLRLNIYTPLNVNSNSRLPVFVWIFGGGFNIGFYGRFMYGPKFLVRDDIIVVTINYRLGPYGFFCLDIPEVPGNQGLKDQVTALRWVRSHIEAFGGDPNQVTIGGNSAGSVSADLLIHRDNSGENLFNKAILQSGTTQYSSYIPPLKDAPFILARYFDFNTEDIYEALQFLATIPPRDLIIAESELGTGESSFCIERSFEGVEHFLTANWMEREIPIVNNMSIIIGLNSDELGMSRRYTPTITDFEDYLRPMFYTDHEDFRGMTEIIHQFYNGDETILDGYDNIVDFSSDTAFVYATYRTIYKYIENDANIYFYNFSHVGDRNFVRRRIGFTLGGVYHADEISYVFDMSFIPDEPTANDQLVIDKMTRMWTNFVKYGNPTPELTELIDVKWEPIGRNTPIYSMNINTQLSLTTSPLGDRVTFWDMIYERVGHLQTILSYFDSMLPN